MAADDLVAKVRAACPFPWTHVVRPNGLVQVFDSTGKEVPLFTLIEFANFLTMVMEKQKAAA